MAGKKRNSSFEILTAMQDLNTPAGALQLAQILHLPSASIGRELLEPVSYTHLRAHETRGNSFGAETPGRICGGGMCRSD